MKAWLSKAKELLQSTLEPPMAELNELDWKADLSQDKRRLTEHLSAFSNQPGGGYLVFGIGSTGQVQGVTTDDAASIINKLVNLGRSGLEPQIILEHQIDRFAGLPILFVRIPESDLKPVHIRGKSIEETFIRSGGTTRKASRQEVGTLMLHSRTPRWEELHATNLLSDEALLASLNAPGLLELLGRSVPRDGSQLISWMQDQGLIQRDPSNGGYITNLGAISAAKRLDTFPDLSRKALRVIEYAGDTKANTRLERITTAGYAIGFQAVLDHVVSRLPQSEVIRQALRTHSTVYPELALRELIANALIHQDFTVTGSGPMVEIYDGRIEISNPGGLLPSKRLDRLIGTQPESRNEKLARSFRLYNICEERGSGLIKAGLEVELYGLPPIQFEAGSNHFKVTLHAPRTFAQMSPRERLDACYQHAVLKHYSGQAMTNTSLRERLKMPAKQASMVSAIIKEALDFELIKPADPENRSRKFAEYIPEWA